MIRRSTLVFLTCLGAIGIPAVSAIDAVAEAPILVAQSQDAPPSDAPTSNVLSIGARGRAVRALQNRLEETGYYSGPIDGIYGLATQRAVVAFQEDQGFEPTGRLDDATWEALEAFDPESAEQPSTSDAPAEPITSSPPTADSEPASEPPTAAEPERAESGTSGLVKAVGVSLGLAALLASFGVGFFMANRSKSDVEEDLDEGEEWSEAGLDAEAASGNGAMPSAVANGSASFGSGNGTTQNIMAASSNGGVTNGAMTGAMARVPATSGGGQLGSTAPMAQSDIFDGLIKDLHNPDPHQRRKVIWELGQRGNSLAVQPLVDAMIDADSKEKSLVLAALSEIGMRSLRPMNRALAIALQDDNPEVRKNAIRDLTRIYELVVQISQMLGHAQEDEDPEVRQTAAWALEQLNRIRQTQDIDSNMRSSLGGSPQSLPANGPKTNRFAL